ncbi:MAG: hypothetical protein HAW67_02980 [Endozoicomonadaceae bacterium]|nr:hypothetical protein [Endozoicomonadaceae bacterium]MBE8232672.1 hypothetical protein [Endozoicomonadaceae bacterium]
MKTRPRIQKQFHHLIRTIPGIGQIIVPGHEEAIETVLKQGCWAPIVRMKAGHEWDAQSQKMIIQPFM